MSVVARGVIPQESKAPASIDYFEFAKGLVRAHAAALLVALQRPEKPRLGAPHLTPCGCDACLNWWTQQNQDQTFINSVSGKPHVDCDCMSCRPFTT